MESAARRAREYPVAASGDVVQVDERDAERSADAADQPGPGLRPRHGEVERDHSAVRAVLLDLPAILDRDREVVAPAIAGTRDQRAHVRLGAAAVVMDDVQDAARRGTASIAIRISASSRTGAKRIGRDVRAHHVHVMRMTLEQQRPCCARRARPCGRRTIARRCGRRTRCRRARCAIRRAPRAGTGRSPRRSPRRTPCRTRPTSSSSARRR